MTGEEGIDDHERAVASQAGRTAIEAERGARPAGRIEIPFVQAVLALKRAQPRSEIVAEDEQAAGVVLEQHGQGAGGRVGGEPAPELSPLVLRPRRGGFRRTRGRPRR